MGLEDIVVRIRADIAQLVDGLSKAGGLVEQFGMDAADKFKKLGKDMADSGKTVTKLTAPLDALAISSIYSAEKYEKSVNTIRAQTGATGAELEGMAGVLQDAYLKDRQSMEDTASIIVLFNQRLGSQGDELEGLTVKAGRLSRLLGTDVVSTVDSTTKVFTAWGMSADDANNYYDTLLKTAQMTGVNIDELSSAVAGNALMFKSMGYNVDQATLMVANLMASGMSSQDVITGMSMAMRRLTMEQADAKEKLAEGKISLDEYNQIMGLSTSQYLAEYIDKIKNAKTETEANGLALEAFGPRGVNFAKVIREGKLDTDKLTESLKNNSDTVERATGDVGTLTGKLDAQKKQLEEKLIPLGEKIIDMLLRLMPTISKLVDLLGVLVDWFTSLPEPVQEFIIILGGLLIALGPLLIGLGGLISTIGALIPIISAVGAALSGVALGPIAVVVAAIVGLVVVLWWLYNNCTQFRDLVDEVFSVIGWNISATIDGVVTTFRVLGDLLRGDFSGAWKDFSDFVIRTVESMPGPIKTVWNTIIGTINWSVNTAIDLINGLIDTVNKIPGVHFDKLGHASISLPGSSTSSAPGSSTSSASSETGGVSKATLRHLGERASGGPVSPGEVYLVGEEGPELFLPEGSGVIIPSEETTGLLAWVAGAKKLAVKLAGARQLGGDVDAGKAYLVGEEGPELFLPEGSGLIAGVAGLLGGATGSRSVERPIELSVRIENVIDGNRVGETLVRRIIRERGVRL